jgi:hypothetical protein
VGLAIGLLIGRRNPQPIERYAPDDLRWFGYEEALAENERRRWSVDLLTMRAWHWRGIEVTYTSPETPEVPPIV